VHVRANTFIFASLLVHPDTPVCYEPRDLESKNTALEIPRIRSKRLRRGGNTIIWRESQIIVFPPQKNGFISAYRSMRKGVCGNCG
jgi:hypothetical protein